MGDKLTQKEETYCQKYVECTSQIEAYTHAYDVDEAREKNGIYVDACRLHAKPKIALRIYELQQEAAKRTLVTVESITKELNEAISMAREQENVSGFTGAVMGKAKIHGLDVKKIDMTLNADFSVLDKAKQRNAKREKPES